MINAVPLQITAYDKETEFLIFNFPISEKLNQLAYDTFIANPTDPHGVYCYGLTIDQLKNAAILEIIEFNVLLVCSIYDWFIEPIPVTSQK